MKKVWVTVSATAVFLLLVTLPAFAAHLYPPGRGHPGTGGGGGGGDGGGGGSRDGPCGSASGAWAKDAEATTEKPPSRTATAVISVANLLTHRCLPKASRSLLRSDLGRARWRPGRSWKPRHRARPA